MIGTMCGISQTSHSIKEHLWIAVLFYSRSLFLLTKMKFSIKDFFSKCDQIRSFLRIWSHLLKKSLTLSWRRPLSYRNQSLRKSMDWFLYDQGLHHEKVNGKLHFLCSVGVLRESCSENMQQIYRKLLKICSKVSQVSQENIHYHLKMKANLLEWKNVR